MSAAIVLSIDVGNSRIKLGLVSLGEPARPQSALPECKKSIAIEHGKDLPWTEIAGWLSSEDREAARTMLAGVHPEGVSRLLAEWPGGSWPRPVVVRRAADLPLTVRVDAPDAVGIDRLLNAVAANAIRPSGRAAVVVSCGTATTVDLIAGDGAFEGGAILPGLELGARCLNERTALLPFVSPNELSQSGLPVLGKSTVAAIRSGLLYGHVGAIRELISRLSAGQQDRPLVILTGGNGAIVAPLLAPSPRFEPDLPLRALALLADSRGQPPPFVLK